MIHLVLIGVLDQKLKRAFEQQFPQCKLNYVAFASNGTLFNRVRLEGKKIEADVVLEFR